MKKSVMKKIVILLGLGLGLALAMGFGFDYLAGKYPEQGIFKTLYAFAPFIAYLLVFTPELIIRNRKAGKEIQNGESFMKNSKFKKIVFLVGLSFALLLAMGFGFDYLAGKYPEQGIFKTLYLFSPLMAYLLVFTPELIIRNKKAKEVK